MVFKSSRQAKVIAKNKAVFKKFVKEAKAAKAKKPEANKFTEALA